MWLVNKLTGIKIGSMDMSPARKKPCLVVNDGKSITKYASFNNEMAALEFMEILADFVSAEK